MTREQRTRLADALLDAYPQRNDLARLLHSLGRRLDDYVGDVAMRDVVTVLTPAAAAEGWLGDLVEAIFADRPDNAALREWATEHLGAFAPSRSFVPGDQESDLTSMAEMLSAPTSEGLAAALLATIGRSVADPGTVQQIAAASRRLRHEYYRGIVLRELDPAVPGVYQEIARLRDPFWQAMAAARMPPEVRDQARVVLPPTERRAWVHMGQPSEYRGPAYQQFVDELTNTDPAHRQRLLSVAQAIAPPADRAAALLTLISDPSVDLADPAAVAEAAAAAAESVSAPRRRVGLLTELAGATGGDLREALLGRALSASRYLLDPAQRAGALATIAGQLGLAQSGPIVAEARELALSVEDRAARAGAIAALLGSVPEPDRSPLFEELNHTVGGLEVAAAAPALAESAPARPLAERGEHLDRALDAIRAVHQEPGQARLMQRLARGLARADDIETGEWTRHLVGPGHAAESLLGVPGWRIGVEAPRHFVDLLSDPRLADALRQPQRSLRHANVWFVEVPGHDAVPRQLDLAVDRPYILRLSIGELDPRSIVDSPTPFPAEALPPREEGNWLDVAVASADFEVPSTLFPIFLPLTGAAWVCPCTPGERHSCQADERNPFLDIDVVTPSRAGSARLRIGIYYKQNVVQSQLVRAEIAPVMRPGRGTWSVTDYTLTTGLADVERLPGRAVSILVNEGDDASHLIMFNDNKNDVVSFHLTEGQMTVAVAAARRALYDAHVEEYGGKLGAQIQRRNKYDERNAKRRADFKTDLKSLAEVGRLLWDALFGDQRERARELRHTTLTQPAVIQIARAGRSTYVFPWALLYELAIEPGNPDAWWYCPIVDEWDTERDFTGANPDSCPYEDRHDELNILCPYGFWGVRHVIEQPPSVPRLAREVTSETPPPRAVMVKSKQLDATIAEAHVTQVTKALSGFLMCPADSRTLAGQWLGADAMELIYFYCHGLDAPLPGAVPQPYLGIGVDDRLVPGDLGVWFENVWSPQHWERTAPLIFINGCHTIAITPSSLVQFVDAFAGVRAAGVVGTEITLDQRVASEAGAVFLGALRPPGATVGAALRTARLHLLRKGNLMGLAYTAYCSADLGFAGLPPSEPLRP